MTLKGKRPGCEHTSCAFRNVVHFFCSTLSPPTSLCGSGVGAQILGRRAGRGAGVPARPPASSHLADPGHPRHQQPLEEVELIGRLLEEEVDLVVVGDAEGSHEGGVGCGARPGVRRLTGGGPSDPPRCFEEGGGRGGDPAGSRSSLTREPAEEGVRLEQRAAAQRAGDDGLVALEVVHGAGVELAICSGTGTGVSGHRGDPPHPTDPPSALPGDHAGGCQSPYSPTSRAV